MNQHQINELQNEIERRRINEFELQRQRLMDLSEAERKRNSDLNDAERKISLLREEIRELKERNEGLEKENKELKEKGQVNGNKK